MSEIQNKKEESDKDKKLKLIGLVIELDREMRMIENKIF